MNAPGRRVKPEGGRRKRTFRIPHSAFRIFSSRSGQALVEMTVALVGILAIFAGLLTIAHLGSARSTAMLQARYEAGQYALAPVQLSEAPSPMFIHDWNPGTDRRRHSADDQAQIADPSVAVGVLMQPSHPAFGDTLETFVPGNNVSALDRTSFMDSIGLVHARATSNNVSLLPAVQHLIYGAESIRIDADVTMTWSRGIN